MEKKMVELYRDKKIETYPELQKLISSLRKHEFSDISEYPVNPEKEEKENEKNIIFPACVKKDKDTRAAYSLILYTNTIKYSAMRYKNLIADAEKTMGKATNRINDSKSAVYNALNVLFQSDEYKKLKAEKEWDKLAIMTYKFRHTNNDYMSTWDEMQTYVSEYVKARNNKSFYETCLDDVKASAILSSDSEEIPLSIDGNPGNPETTHYIYNVLNITYTNNICDIMAIRHMNYDGNIFPVYQTEKNGKEKTEKNSITRIYKSECELLKNSIGSTIERFKEELNFKNKVKLSTDLFETVKDIRSNVITINKSLFLNDDMCNTHFSYKGSVACIVSLIHGFKYEKSGEYSTRKGATKRRAESYFKDMIEMSLYEYYKLNKPEKNPGKKKENKVGGITHARKNK